MANTDLVVKRKKLSKELKAVIKNVGMRESDVAYLIHNLMWGNNKHELLQIVEDDKIPIAVQIFAHALIEDYKKGAMSNQMQMMMWAFEKTVKTPTEKVQTEEELDEEIKELLTKQKL